MTSSICFVFFVVQILLSLSRDHVSADYTEPSNPDYWSVDDFQPVDLDYDIFDLTLTKRISSISDQNFLISPLGLKLAMAILNEAATGATQAEISAVLGFDLDRTVVRKKFATIIESLKKESPEYILNLGSRIYLNEKAYIRQRFDAIAKEFYKTDIKTTNFEIPEMAANDVNCWVSNITQGRIPHLVEPSDMEGLIVLILNTLYFKGTWRHQFLTNATKSGPFYVTPKIQKTVPFMNAKRNFYYISSSKFDAKILRMSYRSNKYAMYIVVPNSLTGLPYILNNLGDLRGEFDKLEEEYVEVTIPKFKFEYTSRMDNVLKELGLRQVFEDSASLPGLARSQPLGQRLKVSKVLQRSGIEVNEVGSVAYSATAIGIVDKFAGNPVIEANRPFLFLIQDDSTRQLLFIGRVTDPSDVDGDFKH